MPAAIQRETNDRYVLHIRGILRESEFRSTQDTVASAIDGGVKPRLLVILENFEGWERGAEWGNLDFMYWHSPEIAKIAIVGDPRWELEAMAFGGADLRKAPMRFFPSDQQDEARAWLEE